MYGAGAGAELEPLPRAGGAAGGPVAGARVRRGAGRVGVGRGAAAGGAAVVAGAARLRVRRGADVAQCAAAGAAVARLPVARRDALGRRIGERDPGPRRG